ncbi:hypothetical protein K5549_010990 [Capra hircus]|nr:hypothetical protein K5549_010990 [Capra hircus]
MPPPPPAIVSIRTPGSRATLLQPALQFGLEPGTRGRSDSPGVRFQALVRVTAGGWAAVTLQSTPVFTPRVIGTAVARYNFAARDLRELSLREGDVVKIYSRIGGDQGWWKGETNGRKDAYTLPPTAPERVGARCVSHILPGGY